MNWSWILPQFQRATEARQHVAGDFLYEGPESCGKPQEDIKQDLK